MSASGMAYCGSTRTSSPLASCGAMSHRLRSMMPWPARHQSRTISPELLASGPCTRTRAVLPSRAMAQRPSARWRWLASPFSRATRQSCEASASTVAGVPRRFR
jgi:hypothetical protein